MRYIKYFCMILFMCTGFLLPCAAQSLTGIWENSERFIEFTEMVNSNTEGSLRIVLKTYYRFVYEDMGSYPITIENEHTGNIYPLKIRYHGIKAPVTTDVWVHSGGIFTSFYKNVPHSITTGTEQSKPQAETVEVRHLQSEAITSVQSAPLNGFWVEQGFRDGILIYQQEIPAFFNAFFFNGTQYIKFRYWKGDFEYTEKHAGFICDNGLQVAVPKFIRQYGTLYRCITDNGSKLKNYEKGTVSIDSSNGMRYLTLIPQGGGPGTHAVGDVYPHQSYPNIKSLPLYYDESDGVFAFGEPFATRSSITDLQEEITRHNGLKRTPPEPLLKADELDFYWERIKEIRKQD